MVHIGRLHIGLDRAIGVLLMATWKRNLVRAGEKEGIPRWGLGTDRGDYSITLQAAKLWPEYAYGPCLGSPATMELLGFWESKYDKKSSSMV